MLCYRIMSERYATDPYAASGSMARWNPGRTRMLYCSNRAALALLEYICIKGTAVGTKSWHLITFEISEENLIAELDKRVLPKNWADLPHPKNTQDFGRQWLDAREEPFLKVPSARLGLQFYPSECNLLINPDFPDLKRYFKVVSTMPFNYLLNARIH